MDPRFQSIADTCGAAGVDFARDPKAFDPEEDDEPGSCRCTNLYLRPRASKSVDAPEVRVLVIKPPQEKLNFNALSKRLRVVGKSLVKVGAGQALEELGLEEHRDGVTPFALTAELSASLSLVVVLDPALMQQQRLLFHALTLDSCVALTPPMLLRWLQLVGCRVAIAPTGKAQENEPPVEWVGEEGEVGGVTG